MTGSDSNDAAMYTKPVAIRVESATNLIHAKSEGGVADSINLKKNVVVRVRTLSSTTAKKRKPKAKSKARAKK